MGPRSRFPSFIIIYMAFCIKDGQERDGRECRVFVAGRGAPENGQTVKERRQTNRTRSQEEQDENSTK